MTDNFFDDTICAPATPSLTSAIALIRVSGVESFPAANKIFSNSQKLKPRIAVYGTIIDGSDIIDDVIMVYYQAPSSFSGEDMLEISCHGNPLIIQKIINLLLKNNIRLAQPGEFSKRAFVNGKIDLTAAEAINQIIIARSEWELSTAIKQMHGSFKSAVESIRNKLLIFKGDIECSIDFIEQDVDEQDTGELISKLNEISDLLHDLYRRCKIGEKINKGVEVPIIGKPNVGKSSLLNLILNEERAIVSDIPGTTRDIIKETIKLGGIHINLLDTAGIDKPGSMLEGIGIELSHKKIISSSLVLVVLDATTGLQDADYKILSLCENKPKIFIINKIDDKNDFYVNDIREKLTSEILIEFSAKKGVGLDFLEESISEFFKKEYVDHSDSLIADLRIFNILERSFDQCKAIRNVIEIGENPEIIAYEIQDMIDLINEITGEISADDVLNSIFSRFCIGK